MERAVVTGAAVGIGKALADRLEREGPRVWRADIQGDPPVDVTDEAQLAALIAGIDATPHPSPAYAAAKAGLVRFTTAYAGQARMSCIVPGWIATPRGLREREAMTPAEREAAGPMVSMEAIADAMVGLLRDGTARGRIVVIR